MVFPLCGLVGWSDAARVSHRSSASDIAVGIVIVAIRVPLACPDPMGAGRIHGKMRAVRRSGTRGSKGVVYDGIMMGARVVAGLSSGVCMILQATSGMGMLEGAHQFVGLATATVADSVASLVACDE